MNTFYKKAELIANIAIIVVAISLVALLAKRFVFKSAAPPSDSQQLAVGQKLSLPGTDWAKNNKTVVLVLSQGCHYCAESAPFYQRLVREQAQRASFHLTAVLPQAVSEGRRYLDGLGISINEISQLPPGSIGIRGTPTLLIVNNAGVVTDSWLGKLPPETEAEVLSRLQ